MRPPIKHILEVLRGEHALKGVGPMSPEQVRSKLGLEPDWRGSTTRALCIAISAADTGATVVFVIHRLDRRVRVRDVARRMLGTLDRVDLMQRLIITTEGDYGREVRGRSGVLVHDGGRVASFDGTSFSPWIEPGAAKEAARG